MSRDIWYSTEHCINLNNEFCASPSPSLDYYSDHCSNDLAVILQSQTNVDTCIELSNKLLLISYYIIITKIIGIYVIDIVIIISITVLLNFYRYCG